MKENYAVCIDREGIEHAAKLMELLRPYREKGWEVDMVDLSADGRGGAMAAVVNGIIIMAEVHGK